MIMKSSNSMQKISSPQPSYKVLHYAKKFNTIKRKLKKTEI